MLKVKSISAKAFRGICEERTLVIDGKNLLILGDNGTGKSSFIEALEYALTGDIATLSQRGQHISLNKHCTHIACKDDERRVDILLTDGRHDYKLTRTATSFICPAEIESYVKAASVGNFVLRRSKLLAFVDSRDAERYQSIRSFLDLTEYEKFEQNLKKVSDNCNISLNTATANLNILEKQARDKYEISDDKQLEDILILSHLNIIMELANLTAMSALTETNIRLDLVIQELEKLGDISGISALEEARLRLDDYLFDLPTHAELSNLNDMSQAYSKEMGKATKLFYEDVLLNGYKWIKEGKLEECPLCEGEIDRERILIKIEERLFRNKSLTEASKNAEFALDTVRTKLQRLSSMYENAHSKWIDAKLPSEMWPFDKIKTIQNNLLNIIGTKGLNIEFESLYKEITRFLEIDIESIKVDAKTIIEECKLGYPDQEQINRLLSIKDKCSYYLNDYHKVNLSRELLSKAQSINKKITQLYSYSIEARKVACSNIFKEIESDICNIYTSFHPDESLGGFKVEVKQTGTGSVILKGDFATRTGEDIRGLYSEAHQDTLGLAIFLALCKRTSKMNSNFRLIALDDILASVDGQHRERVAKYLLNNIAQDHQIIITTHNRPWFEWLIRIQINDSLQDKFINKKITGWSLQNGPRISDSEFEYEQLVKLRTSETPSILAALAAHLLESILQGLRYSLKLAVQARRGELYTIGDIWPIFYSKASKDFRHIWPYIEPECKVLKDFHIIRNWEIHNTEWAKELSDKEILNFVDSIITIYPKVFCNLCGCFVELGAVPQGIISCRKGCINYLPPVTVSKRSDGFKT